MIPVTQVMVGTNQDAARLNLNALPRDRRAPEDRHTDTRAASRRDVKVKFDYFEGTYDPLVFLEWVQTTEHTLRHCRYDAEEVVDVVTLHFRGAARTWWHRYEADRRRRNLPPIQEWDQLVHVMTRKYVPSNFREKMRYDVASATQGTLSPQEFLAHLEDLYYKAGSVVSTGTLRDRFVAGLNEHLRDRVEVLPYRDFNELVLTAQRYHEQDIRKRRQWQGSSTRYTSRPSVHSVSTERSSSSMQPGTGPPRGAVQAAPPRAAPIVTPPPATSERARDLECYKCGGRGHMKRDCPNQKKVLFSSTTAAYESVAEESADDVPDQQAEPTEEDAYECPPLDYNAGTPLSLVTRRVLLGQEATLTDQRENLFHTRCLVQTASLSVIIDGGSCTNIVNEKVVQHLNLPMTPHPQPYGLQWLSTSDGNIVKSQCLISFSIGPYNDTVLCDVVRMDATHLLLGRPWQFDRRVLHDGFLNTYMFTFHGKRVTLLPLSPSEILQDTAERARQKAIEEAAAKDKLAPDKPATSSTSPDDILSNLRRGEAARQKEGTPSTPRPEPLDRGKLLSAYRGRLPSPSRDCNNKLMLARPPDRPPIPQGSTLCFLVISTGQFTFPNPSVFTFQWPDACL